MPRYSCFFPRTTLSSPTCPYWCFSISMMSVTTFESMWEIFKSSTCQTIVHCFPLITLLATHQSYYSLMINPSSVRLLDNFFQNSSAAFKVPRSYTSLEMIPRMSYSLKVDQNIIHSWSEKLKLCMLQCTVGLR